MSSSGKPRVFVTRQIPAHGLDRVVAQCDACVWPDPLPPPREALLKHAAGCHGLLTLLTDKVDAELMDAAGPQLKVISNFAVGYNNVDVAEATRRGIKVGNTPGVLTESTADIAFALLMAASRRIVESEKYIRANKWKTWEPLGHIGVDLLGKTIGIVGLGRIGHAMAKRCHGGWGMQVLYNNRRRNEAVEMEMGARYVDFDTLLRESDFVSVHCDLNDSTRALFNAAAFSKMKKSAVFINTSRGPVVDQMALHAALANGSIFAAGLDVTDPEPLPLEHPLYSLPNCVIVPHIASATVSSRNGMAEISTDNLLRGLAGQPLRHCVNP